MKKLNKTLLALSLLSIAGGVFAAGGGILNSSVFSAESDCFGYHYVGVEPSFENPGHREYWICCNHNPHHVYFTEPQDGSYKTRSDDQMNGGCAEEAVLPKLSEKDYIRSSSINAVDDTNVSATETWTLKSDETVVLSKTYINHGFIKINSTYYLPYDFNKIYSDMTLSYDDSSELLTLKVTNPKGASLDNLVISVPFDSLTITGAPLTINAKSNNDGLAVKQTTTIDNDTTLQFYNNATSTSKSGFNTTNFTVNEGASVTCKNFGYGIYLQSGGTYTINGDLDFCGKSRAFYGFSSSRVTLFDSNHSFYYNETFYKKGGEGPVSLTSSTAYNAKHIIITANPYIIYKNDDVTVTTEPTVNTEGAATVLCSLCGTSHNIVLPKLSSNDYIQGAISRYEDGTLYDYPLCVWKHKTKSDSLVFTPGSSKEEAEAVLVAGTSYYSAKCLETLFPNLDVRVDNNELIFELDGDVNFTSINDTSLDGALNLNSFSQVKITGKGTLNITSNQTTAISAKKLTIDNGVTLELSGTNYLKDSYTTAERDGSFDGLAVSESLIINGNLNVENFYVGIYTKGTCLIGKNGSVALSKILYGVYSNGILAFTSEGNISIETQTKGSGDAAISVGFLTNNVQNTFHFTGNSTTTVKTGFTGFGTVSTSTGHNLTVRASGNAELNVETNSTSTKSYALKDISHLIIENEDGSQCNATASFSANSAGAVSFLAYTSQAHSFIINSQRDVTFRKTGTKVSQNGINFNSGKYTIKVLSKVTVARFNNALNFGSSATGVSVVCDHQIINSECVNNFGGTGGTGISTLDKTAWFYVEE